MPIKVNFERAELTLHFDHMLVCSSCHKWVKLGEQLTLGMMLNGKKVAPWVAELEDDALKCPLCSVGYLVLLGQ